MPAIPHSTDPAARFRVAEAVLVWPAEATVTAAQVEQFGKLHGTDLAALVAAGTLRPVGPEHPQAPEAPAPANG